MYYNVRIQVELLDIRFITQTETIYMRSQQRINSLIDIAWKFLPMKRIAWAWVWQTATVVWIQKARQQKEPDPVALDNSSRIHQTVPEWIKGNQHAVLKCSNSDENC